MLQGIYYTLVEMSCSVHYSALFSERVSFFKFYVFIIMLRFSANAFIFKLRWNCIDTPAPYFEK